MRAEVLVPRWAALLLGVALLSTSCATRTPLLTGGTPYHPHATPVLGDDRGVGASSPPPPKPSEPGRLHRRKGARGLGSEIITVRLDEEAEDEASIAGLPPAPPTCGGLPLPPDWPDFSSPGSEALLAPLFSCTPAEFVALQQRVDMPRLVRRLDAWGAVRLGALGPVREDAAEALNLKRAAFLATTTREYGPPLAEVFALFVLHSSHDDDLQQVLGALAREKQLTRTLGDMAHVQQHLHQRGLQLSHYPDRPERGGDVLRGAREGLGTLVSSIPLVQVGGSLAYDTLRRQLPEDYRQALLKREEALVSRGLAEGHTALAVVDEVTLGIPLGTWHLLAGTLQGLHSLTQGRYEEGTRALTPAALAVAVYAGGKALRPSSAGAPGGGRGLALAELRSRLARVVEGLEARLGGEALEGLARHIRARREAARFVALGGPEAAVALHEAGGNVPRAQAWLSQAKSNRPGSSRARGGARASAGQPPGGALASLVDEGVGLTREVLKARLALLELEAQGPRLPTDVAVLKKHRPSPDAPLPGGEGNPRWREYVAYYERRLKEIEGGTPVEGPLHWKSYERLWGWFTRGLAFERTMMALLEADAKLPRAQRRFLGAFLQPRIERYVGVWKPGSELRFADVLVIEEGGLSSGPPRVETFSFKSRDLSRLDPGALEAQMKADAREALWKYGGMLDIRRSALQPLFSGGSVVPIQRIRLIYEGGPLKPNNMDALTAAVNATKQAIPEVEVLFQ